MYAHFDRAHALRKAADLVATGNWHVSVGGYCRHCHDLARLDCYEDEWTLGKWSDHHWGICLNCGWDADSEKLSEDYFPDMLPVFEDPEVLPYEEYEARFEPRAAHN